MKREREGDNRYWIGFDLGGSKMLAVAFDPAFRPIARKRKRTKGREGAGSGVQRMAKLIGSVAEEAGISTGQIGGIGIGCPGPLDLARGVVLEMPNLGWKKLRLKDELEKAVGCPTVVMNDVDAGVYGEYRLGAARGARSCVGVFPGTGIGGGAVYEGDVIRGKTGSCLEIGHIPVSRDGPLCGCGRRGCLEAVAGRVAVSAAAAAAAYRGEAPNLLRLAGTDIDRIRSGALAEAIAAGDRAVEMIMRDAARTVGWALAGVINLLAPDVVVLGGGMVEDMPDLWRDEVEAAARSRVMPSFENTFEVMVTQLGGDATVIGAAAWAQHQIQGVAPTGSCAPLGPSRSSRSG